MSHNPENPFHEPNPERVLDAALLELLERDSKKINEGQNGVIFRLNVTRVPKPLQEQLESAGIDLEEDPVAKVLKLNYAGKGRKEFEMQKRAHELVAAQPDADTYAHIPPPKLYRSLPVTKSARETLQMHGVHAEDVCEVIIMDEVRGDDIATALYREAVRRHPKTVHVREQVDEMDFSELQKIISDALEFAAPGGKSRDEEERKFEERKVFAQNSTKLFRFLAQRGFRVDPSIIEKMERTMDLFHANGLCHRDAHHRNFMVVGKLEEAKPGEPKPEVYVIDFGAMTEFEGAFTEEIYTKHLPSGGVAQYPSDTSVPKELRTYFLPDEVERAQRELFLRELASLRKRLTANAGWQELLKKETGADLGKLFRVVPTPKLQSFFVAMQVLVEDSRVDAAAVRTFLEAEKQKRPPSEANAISSFLRTLP